MLTAIDIGGTFIKYAVVSHELEIIEKGRIPTPGTREGLVDSIGRLSDQYSSAKGLAVSMPGLLDVDKGLCVAGGGLEYNSGFYVRSALEQRCGIRVSIENDARCGTFAEMKMGSMVGVKNGIVLLFGTMIGGGLIIDSKIYRGSDSFAGEVSYIMTESNGIPTRNNVWGNRCGVPELCHKYEAERNKDEQPINGEKLMSAYDSGDPLAAKCLNEFTNEIAVQIYNLQTVLHPEKIAIGGGISGSESFIELIGRQLDVIYDGSYYKLPKAKVVRCLLGNDANLYGAAINWGMVHGESSG